MTYQPNNYTGNGTNRLFTVSFPYLSQADVVVEVGETALTPVTDYTFSSASQIETTVAPAAGVPVRIYRVTPTDEPQATFQAGSAIPAADLNDNFKQTLFVAQELVDTVNNSEAGELVDLVTSANTAANLAVATALTAQVTAEEAEDTANSIAGTAEAAQTDAANALIAANAASAAVGGKVNRSGDTFTGNVAVPRLNGGQLAGLRNLIINGNMQVSQRAGSFNVPNNTGVYTLDRWLVVSNGSICNVQQVIADRAARMRVTGAAGNIQINVYQRIESWDIAHLAGQNVTISFDVSNSLNTTLTVGLTYPNSPDVYTTFTAGATAIVSVTPTLSRYSVTLPLTSQVINGLQVGFGFSSQTSGSFDLTNVQLEVGSLATPFETLPLPIENTLCKRFFHWVPLNIFGVATGGGQVAEVGVPYPTRMRGIPTVGTLTGIPGIATSANNAAQGVSRLTDEWAAPFVQSGTSGVFYVVGFQYPLTAEL